MPSNTDRSQVVSISGHQESRPPECNDNKTETLFDKNLGFVIEKSCLSDLPCKPPLDMKDPAA